jgi:hypothetical protein
VTSLESSNAAEIAFAALRAAELSTDDVLEIARFFGQAFETWPARGLGVAAGDHLAWKLEGAGDGAAVILGRLDHEIVVGQTFWRQPLRVRGREHTRIAFNDLAVSHRHRGKGLSSQENRFKDAYFSQQRHLRIGSTSQPRLKRQWARRGLRALASPVHSMLLPLAGPRLGGATRLRAPAEALLGIALSVSSHWFRRRQTLPAADDVEIRSVERFDSRTQGLFERCAQSFDIVAVRSPHALNWRYRDPRSGPFVARAAWGPGDQLLGYAVASLRHPWAALADLLVEPGRPDVAAALVDDAIVLCRRPGIYAIQAWLPSRHAYVRALRGRGFSVVGPAIELGCRTVGLDDEETSPLWDPDAKLHFMLGDTDFV